ncbi:uncharacterized protein LOC129568967 isoform X4 [Sitodiplosis mosellana]|nr:uncharacterized protein LOC129568967 isoform X4 [Sitodiplosis mosellana]
MDHSLEETLRSPCREEKIPAREDHNESNIKGILQVIKRQSAIAKSIARQDVAQYISLCPYPDHPQNNTKQKLKITEDTSVEDFHYRWRIMEQEWLYPRGKLSKEFGQSVPESEGEHFRAPARKFNIEAMRKLLIERLSKLLQDCDERFQLLMIGFHNVLDDHNTKRSTMDLEKYNPLYEVFARAKTNAQMVLCEIRTALHKLGAPIVVLNPHNIRSSKAPNSSFYDWVIFREYINQLEHINEVVNIILENI